MSSQAGITTTEISQSDQIHLAADARNSYEPTVGILVWSCEFWHNLIVNVLQKPDLSAIPAATKVLQNNNPETALSSLGEAAAPYADAQKLEGQLENAGFKSQSDSTGILSGKDDISQTHVNQDLALQQGNLAPTYKVFDISRREVNYESIQLHNKLQSVLRRVVELERRLGAVRDNKFLRRERIQLGLEISVAGEHGVSAPGFPFMMVILALVVAIIPGAYKYYVFSA